MAENLYITMTRRKIVCLVMLAFAVVITFLIDLCTGPAALSVADVFRFFFSNQGDSIQRIIVFDLRLPMALMAVLAGSALAVAGAEIQTVLDNSLACSHTMGISAAAGFGAAIVLVFGAGVTGIATDILISVSAFGTAMFDCLLIFLLSRMRGITKGMIILIGIALMFTFNSLLGFIEYYSSADILQAIVFWLFGNLSKASWPKLAVLAGLLITIMLLFALDAWKLTALRLGDAKAKSLGVNARKIILKALILSSVLASVVSSFVGIIGFVGLVAPHIARMLVGEDQRFYLFGSALSGAVILSGADIFSKVLIKGAIIPIGIVTSFIGVPFFVYLIMKRKKEL